MAKQEGAVVPQKFYQDTKFMSRVLVLPSGRIARVAGGRIGAIDAELEEFLVKHPDFKAISE